MKTVGVTHLAQMDIMEIERLSKEENNLKDFQKAFNDTYDFVDKVYEELTEGSRGLRTFNTVIKNLEYHAPQTYEFHQCAKLLGFELKRHK